MAKIVAFSVPGITDGETALHELDGVEGVADVALVYKNDKGKVKIRQTCRPVTRQTNTGHGDNSDGR